MANELVQVEVDKRQMKSVESLLSAYPKGAEKVLQRSINKVALAARTKIVKEIREDYRLKSGELKRRNVFLKRASRKTLKAHITIKGSRIPLDRFGARQTRTGISYLINRKKGRQRLCNTFFRDDKKGVWKRMKKTRLPITELHGPSVPEITEGISALQRNNYDKEVAAKLSREIDVQIRLLLEKGK